MRCSVINGRLAKGSTQIVLEALSQTPTWVYKSFEVEKVRESIFWEKWLLTESFSFPDYWSLDIFHLHVIWWGEWKKAGGCCDGKGGEVVCGSSCISTISQNKVECIPTREENATYGVYSGVIFSEICSEGGLPGQQITSRKKSWHLPLG